VGMSLRRLRLAAALLAAILILPAAAEAAGAYSNPFTGDQPYIGRTDMGVDACLTPGDPIRAVGNGVVVGIMHDWFQGQPYIWYRLTSGPYAGRYVYVAEQIKGLARIGQTLHAGQVLARYAGKGTCIEMGWSASTGATLAQATTGYTEGEVTAAGISFAHFLISLGVPGTFELAAPKPAPARARPKSHHRKPVHRKTVRSRSRSS
jgi:hypothetical protein